MGSLSTSLGIILLIHDPSDRVTVAAGMLMIAASISFAVISGLLALCKNQEDLPSPRRQRWDAERKGRNTLPSTASTSL
jgi:hypothetical protein